MTRRCASSSVWCRQRAMQARGRGAEPEALRDFPAPSLSFAAISLPGDIEEPDGDAPVASETYSSDRAASLADGRHPRRHLELDRSGLSRALVPAWALGRRAPRLLSRAL